MLVHNETLALWTMLCKAGKVRVHSFLSRSTVGDAACAWAGFPATGYKGTSMNRGYDFHAEVTVIMQSGVSQARARGPGLHGRGSASGV